MNGNCHAIFSTAVAGAMVVNLQNLEKLNSFFAPSEAVITLTFLGAFVGSLLPDMDSSTSHIAKLTKPLSSFFKLMNDYYCIEKSWHRGILHDISVWAVFLMLSFFLSPSLLPVCVGWLSHLYLDAFNKAGVPCILMRRKRFHMGNVPSSGSYAYISTAISSVLVLTGGIIVYIKCL